MVGPAAKTALITAVTGQDGAYLAELLVGKGHRAHGVKRRPSSFNTARVDHLYHDPHESGVAFDMHYGDITDTANVIRIVRETQPDEIYNLAAQSQVSFETPEYGAMPTVSARCAPARGDPYSQARTPDAVLSGLDFRDVRFGAGNSAHRAHAVSAAFAVRRSEPYAHWITVNHREAYRIHASTGILFNHESPIRGETFVTRKISPALAAIELGLQDRRFLGNRDAARDWGPCAR